MSWFTSIRDTVENVAAAPANLVSFGQAQKLTSTGAQNSSFGKASVKVSKAADIVGAVAVGGYLAAPYLATAGSSLLTAAKAAPSVLGSLFGGAPAPAPAAGQFGPPAPAANADFTSAIQPGYTPAPAAGLFGPPAPAPVAAAAAPASPLTATHIALGIGAVGLGLEMLKLFKGK